MTDEEWFRFRNHNPRKYEGRVDPRATSEDVRRRYNRGRYWVIVEDEISRRGKSAGSP
jgi:hypothetical protein